MKSFSTAVLSLALSAPVMAMDVKVVGDQLIMSGRIDGSELARLRDVAADQGDARIRMVVLRDSPGGNLWTSMRVGEVIRDKGWRTAVSGYCFSGCAIIFLGGVERHFTDDKPALRTQIAFHAAYYTGDGSYTRKDSASEAANFTARQWIKRHSGGKLSDAMLDRFEKLEKTEFVHFFDSLRMPRTGQASVFVCSRAEKDPKKKCRPIAGTDVYREGIATSSVLIRSNDPLASLPVTPNGPPPKPEEPVK